MLDDHDDATIRLVAEGLVTLTGPTAAEDELVRLYGRSRAVRAMHGDRHVSCRDHRAESREIVIDLVEATPRTIDLRDAPAPVVPPVPPALSPRVASVYHQHPATARDLEAAGRTYWL